jgi:hypothetical protein
LLRSTSGRLTRRSGLPEPDRSANRISKCGILPYPGFPICRVLHHPPPGLPCTPWSPLIQPVPFFEEFVPFDRSGNLVPPVFLQLSLIFFNQHSQRGFYPLSRLPQHILLPHAISGMWGLIIWLRSSSETTMFFPLVISACSVHTKIFLSTSSTIPMGHGFVLSFILPPSPRANRPSLITNCTCH